MSKSNRNNSKRWGPSATIERSSTTIEKSPTTIEEPRQLLLLDVNGILCCKLETDIAPEKTKGNQQFIKMPSYTMVARRNVRQFVQNLMKSYDVAIFSSTTLNNLRKMLTAILGDALMKRLKFIACRANVKWDPDYGTDENVKSHDTVKYLSDIWGNPYLNPERAWNASNTLLVDNEQQKVRFNDHRNVLVVDEWRYVPMKSEESEESNDDLDDLLLRIVKAMQKIR